MPLSTPHDVEMIYDEAGRGGVTPAGGCTTQAMRRATVPGRASPRSSRRVLLVRASAVPLVDVGAARAALRGGRPSSPAVLEAASQVESACRRTGCFYCVNHGVPVAAVLAQGETFFTSTSAEAKERISSRHSPAFRGYVALGAELTAGVPDLREQLEFGTEEKAAAAGSSQPWPPYERLRGPNQWPDEGTGSGALKGFRSDVEDFMGAMELLGADVSCLVALALGLEWDAFVPLFTPRGHMQLKLCLYPTGAGTRTRTHMGVGAHTDSGFLSLLVQDSVGGLEVLVEEEDGGQRWTEVPPVGDAVVVNLGEVVESLTGGHFVATPHRVVQVESGVKKHRMSAPFFYNPRLDVDVNDFAELMDAIREKPGQQHHQQQRKGKTSPGRIRNPVGNPVLASYGMNAFKSFARSHPGVVRLHHADLHVAPDGTVSRT